MIPKSKAFLIFSVVMVVGICSYLTVRSQPAAISTGQEEVEQAQQYHQKHVEITVVAPVERILPDDTEGLPHERFIIHLMNGTTILVAHDTAMAPRVPINVGSIVKIHGEYIWTPKGGVIHWTHHTDTPRHEGGWIQLNNKVYQ